MGFAIHHPHIKECTKCGETKSLGEFSPRKGKLFARSSRCKLCCAEIARERYRKDPTKDLERATKWQNENRQRVYELARTRYKKTGRTEKMSARVAVNKAIKKGILSRRPCEICGNPKTEAHHSSYEPDKWLDVIFLCPKHHEELHKRLRTQL